MAAVSLFTPLTWPPGHQVNTLLCCIAWFAHKTVCIANFNFYNAIVSVSTCYRSVPSCLGWFLVFRCSLAMVWLPCCYHYPHGESGFMGRHRPRSRVSHRCVTSTGMLKQTNCRMIRTLSASCRKRGQTARTKRHPGIFTFGECDSAVFLKLVEHGRGLTRPVLQRFCRRKVRLFFLVPWETNWSLLKVIRQLKQRRRQLQRKRHLKINIWETVTIL